MQGSMIPAPTFCTCPPLTTGAGTPIPRTESWQHRANCPGRFPLDLTEPLAGPGSESMLDRAMRDA